MYKEDLALNNLEWLIYHKTKPNQVTILSKNNCIIIKIKYPYLILIIFKQI